MSYEEIKVLESDLDDIENKTKEIITYFENKIVDLVDKIENLQRALSEKEKEINNIKETNKKLEGENIAFVNVVNHGRLQNIISDIELAMTNDLTSVLNTKTITAESEDNNQNVVDNNQNHNNSENNQNAVDNNQNYDNVENNHKIENSNASDIIDVDENEDPFSSASDDNWDKDISTVNSNTKNNSNTESNNDDLSGEDTYLEDEYVLNDDDTNDFLFEDEN